MLLHALALAVTFDGLGDFLDELGDHGFFETCESQLFFIFGCHCFFRRRSLCKNFLLFFHRLAVEVLDFLLHLADFCLEFELDRVNVLVPLAAR